MMSILSTIKNLLTKNIYNMDNWKPDGTELKQIIEKGYKGDEEALHFLNSLVLELFFNTDTDQRMILTYISYKTLFWG